MVKLDSSVYTEQEFKNIKKVEQIITNCFDLSPASLKRFIDKLYNPEIDDFYYQKLFADKEGQQHNLRVEKSLQDSNYDVIQNIDNSYAIFKNIFDDFMSNCTFVSYKDYYENRISLDGGKNYMKLQKAIKNYYNEVAESSINNFETEIQRVIKENPKLALIDLFKIISRIIFRENGDVRTSFQRFVRNNKSKIKSFIEENLSSEEVEEAYDIFFTFSHEKALNLLKPIDEFIQTIKEDVKNFIHEHVKSNFEHISSFRLPKDKMKIVISFNFADWLLCSTGESWSSCLNLNTDISDAFWFGLPGLMGDLNRGMIYLNNGKTKEYLGIEVDKFIKRAWFLLTEEGTIHCPRTYPDNGPSARKMLRSFFDRHIIETENYVVDEKGMATKHEIERINNSDDMMLLPYLDGFYMIDGNDYYLYAGAGEYFTKDSYHNISHESLYGGYPSVYEMFQNGDNLSHYQGDEIYHCEECGDGIHEMDVNNIEGIVLCSHCYGDNTFFCEISREDKFGLDNAIEVTTSHGNIVAHVDNLYNGEVIETEDGELILAEEAVVLKTWSKTFNDFKEVCIHESNTYDYVKCEISDDFFEEDSTVEIEENGIIKTIGAEVAQERYGYIITSNGELIKEEEATFCFDGEVLSESDKDKNSIQKQYSLV